MADGVGDKDVALKRKIFNLALNDDFHTLTSIITNFNGSVDFLGACGEAPLHISIFKKNLKLCQLILSKGGDPNFMNSQGDNSLHMACRIGWFEGVQVIYASGRCSIKMVNRAKMTPLAICRSRPSIQDISLLQLYSTWGSDHDIEQEVTTIEMNRSLIAAFLLDKLLAEDQFQRMFLLDNTVAHNKRTFTEENIIRGGISRIGTLQHWGPSFPEGRIPQSWTIEDRVLMAGDPKGLNYTVKKDFVDRYANQSILKAVHNLATKTGSNGERDVDLKFALRVQDKDKEQGQEGTTVATTALLGRSSVLFNEGTGKQLES